MEVYPFHHKNLFFNIITDLDLTFVEIRGILDYLLDQAAFSEESDEFGSGKFYDVQVENALFEIDVHGYEIIVFKRTELKG